MASSPGSVTSAQQQSCSGTGQPVLHALHIVHGTLLTQMLNFVVSVRLKGPAKTSQGANVKITTAWWLLALSATAGSNTLTG